MTGIDDGVVFGAPQIIYIHLIRVQQLKIAFVCILLLPFHCLDKTLITGYVHLSK